MMKNLKIIYISLVLSSLLYGQNDVAQQPQKADSKDYAMQIISMDKIWENTLSPTGKDVVVGIVDSGFNTSHPSLQGQNKYPISNNPCWDSNCSPYDADRINKEKYAHGTHVAGILLGKQLSDNTDNKSPQGIAYNAQYHGVGILNPASTYNGNLYNEFKDKKEIRIINNSWGVKFYPLINRYDADGSYDFKVPDNDKAQKGYQSILTDSQKHEPISTERFFSLLQKEIEINQFNQNGKENLVMGLYKLSQERKVLNIFGAGNSGTVSPSAMAVIPSYDENIRSWLVVGALKTHTTKDNVITEYVEKTEDKITIKSEGIYAYSNHFKGSAQLYALMAPGEYIKSANAYYQNINNQDTTIGTGGPCVDSDGTTAKGNVCYMSGTSMATPMVSGVAALVQEKYPFLNGAQIADVLLTTANKNIEAPKLIVKNSVNGLETQYTVIYISDYSANKTQDGEENKVPLKSGNPQEIDIDQVKQDLQTMLNEKNTNTQKPEIASKATSCKSNSSLTPDCIINNLLQAKDEKPTSGQTLKPENNHNAILTLTKEEVFGQGILDANKALGGLAGLDANRLNLEDIQDFQEIPRTQEVSKIEVSQQKAPQTQTLQATSVSIQAAQPSNTEGKNNANNANSQLSQQEQERKSLIESTKQAFYTLDTTTDNPASTFIFSNDISQRTWDNKYHLDDALNSPKETMQYITKVGLIKKGSGTLVLSGVNTYKGATRVQEGVLEITGKLTESNAYAEGNGILKLTGKDNQKTQEQEQAKSQSQGVQQSQSDSTTSDLVAKNAIARDNGSVILHNNVKVGNLYAQNQGVIYAFSGSAESATITKGSALILTNQAVADKGQNQESQVRLQIPNISSPQANQNTNNSSANLAPANLNLKLLSDNRGLPSVNNNNPIAGTLTLESGGILAGNGKLQGDVENKSGIVMAGFAPYNKAYIDENNTLTIDGSYTQRDTGSLHILYDGSSNTNTKFKASTYNLEGGTLVFVPTYNSERLQANQEITITTADNDNTGNNSFQEVLKQAIEQNNLTVKTLSSNLFDITFDKESFKLKVQAKDNPFNLDSKNTDPNLSNVLQSIFTADNLSKDYEDVIGRLDMNANSKQFNDTIEEIIDSSNLQTQEALYLGQSSSIFENLNFTLSNATALVGIKNNVRLAALSTKQRYAQLLANTSTRSDAYYLPLIQMHSNSRAQILTQFNSSKLKAKSYAANSYALNVQVKSMLTQGLLLGGFIDIDNTQANFKNANVKANTFSIGGNAILSIGDYFDIISSLSAGYGVNKEQRHYNLLSQNLEGNYNSYYAMAQIGVGKNIYLHKKLVVKPMLLMQYNIINNSAYSQSKALFAKSYDSSAYDTLASSLGAHLGVNALDSKSFKVYINAFGFYTYRLNTDLSSNVRFSDFSDKSFIQKENIDRTSIYIGANIGTYYKNYFLQLGFSTQRAESYVRETLNVTLGLEF